MTLTFTTRRQRNKRRIRHLPEVSAAICPYCHLPRDHFKRDRLGQLVCRLCAGVIR